MQLEARTKLWILDGEKISVKLKIFYYIISFILVLLKNKISEKIINCIFLINEDKNN